MADDKVQLPSSMGGLVRYSEETSKVKLKPGHIILFVALVVIIEVILHFYGKTLLGLS